MIEFNLSKAVEIFQTENNISKACRIHCEEIGIEYSEKYRNQLSRLLRKGSVDEDLENVDNSDSNNYSNDKEKPIKGFNAIGADNKLMNIEEYCKHYNLDVNKIRSYKLITHSGIPYMNCVFYTSEEDAVLDVDKHLEEIIQKYINPLPCNIITKEPKNTDFFDRLVFTDVHIGMDVNGKDGDPLYDGVWNKEEISRRLFAMITHVKTYKTSNTLIIDDLGDFLDGLGGQTTRKGHELPQNMNDKEVFDLALHFKIVLVDALINDFDTIICNNTTNDNHSGVFSYFVSSAVKQILEQRYPNKVTVNSFKRFMNHYSVENHTFIVCHGKDIGEQKFGFKPRLDSIQAEKIDQYCKEHKLYNGNKIEFSKGDSHQAIYDDTTSNDFSYYNYPAFSPPSNWVGTNFKKSKSGFNFFNIKKDENIKISIPYWF
jgi:UDP-2,3-diacylglucosamine pyrophosphatase LpxH